MKDPFNILAIGEYVQDVVTQGVAARKNPEAPSLVFNPETDSITPGCAGNVVQNLLKLDPRATIIPYHNYSVIRKQRFVDKESGYILFRVDSFDKLPKDDCASTEGLNNKLKEYYVDFKDLNCIICSSYSKGFLSETFIKDIANKADEFDIPVFLDCKFILGPWSKKATVKINYYEYLEQLKHICNPGDYAKDLIVSLGSNGIWWANKNIKYPVEKVPVVSSIGSGDLVISVLALSHLKGYSMEDSIKFANKAATLKVQRPGTASVYEKEVWSE